MTRAEQIAAVLTEHADCALNDNPMSLGSGTTGEDVWSCGITCPFADDLEEAERNHAAAALDAALAQEGRPGSHRWVDESPVDGWNCADCGHPGPPLVQEGERGGVHTRTRSTRPARPSAPSPASTATTPDYDEARRV